MDLIVNSVGYFWLILTQVLKTDWLKQSFSRQWTYFQVPQRKTISNDWYCRKVCGWPKQQSVVTECDTVARKRWLSWYCDSAISSEELTFLNALINFHITKNSHFHRTEVQNFDDVIVGAHQTSRLSYRPPSSPTPEDVEENLYMCQAKRLEMFPLTFQKLRFDKLPASSRVLRRYAGKANVFIQNWPFALTWQA